jgi:hypothetical protein
MWGLPGKHVVALQVEEDALKKMLKRVNDLLTAGEPALVLDVCGYWVWRVPFIFTMAEQGRVGKIAELDVDVRLGGISFSEGDFIRIAGEAQRLVQDQETF